MDIYLIITFRIISIMTILLISTLIISGKRPIGELPVFDFLTIIVIGAVTGADIAEPEVPHHHIITAIIVMCLFQKLITLLNLKSRFFRKLVCFPPTIIIQDGKLLYKNIKKSKYSTDEILMILREKDVFNIYEVKYGILESSGDISILRFAQFDKVRKKDLQIDYKDSELSYTVISDGKFEYSNIELLNLSKEEVIKSLEVYGYTDISKIFFATMDKNKNIHVSPYDIN